MGYNKNWLKMMGFKNEEEARAEMARRGGNSKGKKKSYNWLRDEPDNASKTGKQGAKARWGKSEQI